MVDHKEKGFEAAIEDSLLAAGGYQTGDPAGFDAALALWPAVLTDFLKASQPDAWAKLSKFHGAAVEAKVVALVAKELDLRGTLDVLRHGVTDSGVKLRLAFFRPASGLNPEALAAYGQNVLTVTRQVRYATKDPALSIDLVLAVNGLPVATAELKNPFTNQTVEHAKHQYRHDRDSREPLLRWKARALVHFAVDPDLVFMTTKLEGKDTFFLPFNRGRGTGAGNPDNSNGYRTAYLWEEVWARDNWLDILGRFVHVEKTEKGKDKAIVFPRYHQWDAVRKVLAHVRSHGAGENYLIEHSAGSGKSNSIAWLAHRLSGLHGADDKPIFTSVIVITDRRVLDKQLQDTIYQFEHKQGVVEKIDSDSNQLAAALNRGTPIIISTIQKFGFILGKLSATDARRYAIVVDEAHGSQTGESAASLKKALAATSLEKAEAENTDDNGVEDEVEAEVQKAIGARGRQPNLSFFAFTATPKKKTMELFGQPGPDGKPEAFHLYSMRQAIEEGFILDVLRNYTTYKTYYRFAKAVDDDPEVEKDKAKRAIARFASLHPHNLAQKTEVMVEHFRAHTRHKIGGRAKAMVVTRSRLHAVRYKEAFDTYIKSKGYTDLGVLVAFSGTVIADGGPYTETGMNGFPEAQLRDRFAGDDFQLLLVAEKYQTGFDQPLLHTMFVDKKLKGLKAVQTLSRLNRMCRGKEDTFVLDFENDAEEIKEAFAPYYERPEIDEPTDPNQLYHLKTNLEAFQFFWKQEVEDFARVFFKPKDKQKPADQGLLHKGIDPAVTRFTAEQDEERREEFRSMLTTYVRLYGFVSQIAAFADADLEKLYAYGRLLRTKLPKREGGGAIDLDDDVTLTYYRLDKTFEGTVALPVGEAQTLIGPAEVGTGKAKDEDLSPLSAVITLANERFGTDFNESDKLFMQQIVLDLAKDDKLAEQARTNTLGNFRHAFDPAAMNAVLGRVERNGAMAEQFMSNADFRGLMLDAMMREFASQARSGDGQQKP
ncbi:type I restriction endonuclease subunit R [Falsiroseomonas tokyonensis]|uniref:Type I restriction endonuclease subunit R n=1 Tax=Falsiroseomonas tokyonensis TaxID=430521 RepID=A0ABV7C6A5_9PROT|nr:DEAD/DEAH box helicase family protein [Falsiroseomonas tokyonensis]MBU8541989.1 type I restriction endonuclease subunit R [Falsiroseomonas tokyonensis]